MKNGWQTKTLGDLCEIELGKTPARANASFWDEKRETSNVWLSIADLLKAGDNVVVDSKEYVSDKGAVICKLVPKGTLLVSFKLTLGRLAFAGRDLFTNEAIAALTIFNERELSKEFLFYCLTFFDWVKAAENDVKLKGMTLNKAKLKVMPVSFPPLAEQQRIVGLLDDVFEGLATAKANAEKNLQNARALFESHLQSVFTQRGPGWQTRTIGDVCEFIRGLTYSKGDEVDVSDNVVLRATNINLATNLLIFDELKYISDKVVVPESKKVKKDSLIICTASGSKSHLGKVAFIDDDYGYAFGGFMGMLTPLSGLLPKYLFHLMTSRDYKDFISALSDGANINNLTFDKLKVFPVPVPPLTEQHRIVAKLDQLSEETQHLARLYERKHAALEALKKSLLHQAFTGEL